ncbi:ROK family transcriptional regulator [Martelella alba]|uniref:ROK family transcriptional regulator n=1 Tax=Martelella alba TaxID=2590451 RepID=A0A506TXR1_9HYPH|nr:ROK family protein [Martelella alba]TPW26863.1 ROK family transcriptional regulator [Martelella alba]
MNKSAGSPLAQELINSADVFSLIATGKANSRSTLLDALGISRATLTSRLTPLLSADIVREAEKTLPSGGRPSRVLEVNGEAGYILAANIGEAYIRVAVLDLRPEIVAERVFNFTTRSDPAGTLDIISREFKELVASSGLSDRIVLGIGLSLPAPIDIRDSSVVRPSVLPEWGGFDIKGWFKCRYDVPVFVEKDVNLMAVYEHRRNFPDVGDMFFVKAGTGIGSGIITDGKIFRGAQGGAGDIGHIQFYSENAPLCRCGKFGCVEARAAGWALARDLRVAGYQAENARDVVHLVAQNKPEAIMSIRKSGQTIGEAIADAVSLLNPSLIVVGGTLAQAHDFLLSGVRELVYQRCLPLATHDLKIVLSETVVDSALSGAAYLVLENIFAPGKTVDFLERYARQREPIANEI